MVPQTPEMPTHSQPSNLCAWEILACRVTWRAPPPLHRHGERATCRSSASGSWRRSRVTLRSIRRQERRALAMWSQLAEDRSARHTHKGATKRKTTNRVSTRMLGAGTLCLCRCVCCCSPPSARESDQQQQAQVLLHARSHPLAARLAHCCCCCRWTEEVLLAAPPTMASKHW